MTGVYTRLLKRSFLSLNVGLAKDFVELLNMLFNKILVTMKNTSFIFI